MIEPLRARGIKLPSGEHNITPSLPGSLQSLDMNVRTIRNHRRSARRSRRHQFINPQSRSFQIDDNQSVWHSAGEPLTRQETGSDNIRHPTARFENALQPASKEQVSRHVQQLHMVCGAGQLGSSRTLGVFAFDAGSLKQARIS